MSDLMADQWAKYTERLERALQMACERLEKEDPKLTADEWKDLFIDEVYKV